MSILVPKPINGWRVFWGEVRIIVLGVLIARHGKTCSIASSVIAACAWKRFRSTSGSTANDGEACGGSAVSTAYCSSPLGEVAAAG